MKNFLAIFTGSSVSMDGFMRLDEATGTQRTQEGIKAWHVWVEKNQASIVDNGAPLGRTKRVTQDGIDDICNAISSYTVVKAEPYEPAAAMFVGHPHFTVFPGDGVEIMECMPTPQMRQQ